MKVTKTIEYYPSCPSCGAANTGAMDRCEYCGALLIKRTVQESMGIQSDAEMENYMEDSSLPVIHGKYCGKNGFMTVFCLIFGGMFVLVPFIVGAAFLTVGVMEPFVFAILIPFMILGVCSLSPIVVSKVNRTKCENGKIVTGIVRGYEDSMVMVNNRPVQCIRLKIDDFVEPKLLIVSTGETRRMYPIGATIRLRNYGNYYMFER